MTQARASTTLDLPEPLGPTTTQMPGSNFRVVADAKDLNPRRVNDFKYTSVTLADRAGVGVGGARQIPHTHHLPP